MPQCGSGGVPLGHFHGVYLISVVLRYQHRTHSCGIYTHTLLVRRLLEFFFSSTDCQGTSVKVVFNLAFDDVRML